mgnify:CR=1 FL=1
MNKNIRSFNENGVYHGYWQNYHRNYPSFKCFYLNGKINGYKEEYYYDFIEKDYKLFYIELTFHL